MDASTIAFRVYSIMHGVAVWLSTHLTLLGSSSLAPITDNMDHQ